MESLKKIFFNLEATARMWNIELSVRKLTHSCPLTSVLVLKYYKHITYIHSGAAVWIYPFAEQEDNACRSLPLQYRHMMRVCRAFGTYVYGRHS